jgi:hypothetical protein
MAGLLGLEQEERAFLKEARKTRRSVLDRMWDEKAGLFFDVDPETGRKSPYKATVCFYPFLTDIAEERHLKSLDDHLFNPKEFWTPFPVPSSSLDDPFFSAYGFWGDKRRNCSWNGRMWLMTNSHMAEVMAGAAVRFQSERLREKSAAFIRQYIKTLFLDGNLKYPTSYEYYNPMTGEAPVFRGVDDYMHSWIVDLIIKYVVGLRVGDEDIIVDPFPFGLSSFSLDNVFVRGHRLRVEYGREQGLRLFVNGVLRAKSGALKALRLKI